MGRPLFDAARESPLRPLQPHAVSALLPPAPMSRLLLLLLLAYSGDSGRWAVASAQRTVGGGAPQQPPERPAHGLCRPMKTALCKDVGYNETIMPNSLNHQDETSAAAELKAFQALIQVNCSASLPLFLCSLYLPVCTILDRALLPCRSLCVEARHGCSELMARFGFSWPEYMACELFPPADRELCVGGPRSVEGGGGGGGGGGGPPVSNPAAQPSPRLPTHVKPPRPTSAIQVADVTSSPPPCPPSYNVSRGMRYEMRLSDGMVLADCALPCRGALFTDSQERFARLWTGVWAFLCAASTAFTVLTFLIDRRRFRYPERPIVFLSGCYLIVSLCYVAGFFLGDAVACTSPYEAAAEQEDLSALPYDGAAAAARRLVATQGARRASCAVLFVFAYFFTMASAIWWVVLTATWLLAAGLKWGHEAIERSAHYFHLAAWAIPAAKTVAVVALGSVDGDPLSGVCFTGLSDRRALVGYVVVPLLVYFALGASFLLAGFVSLFRIRQAVIGDGARKSKLEKLMVRIGVFSVLYTVPAAIVIGCNLYELERREVWTRRAWRRDACAELSYACASPSSPPPPDDDDGTVGFAWIILKYLGYLVVGVTSGFWIWSNKTARAWRNFFERILRGCRCS